MKDPRADLATLVLAIPIAALARASSLLALVLAYAVAWLVVNVARSFAWPPPLAIPRAVLGLGVALVLAVPLRDLALRVPALLEHEALASLSEHVGDRLALERSPAIAPGVVSSERPQTFFVRASGERVRVRFAPAMPWIDAEALGHGVFRVDYDPRAHGAVAPHAARATIEVDGAPYERTLLAAAPAPHPRWLRLSPDRARACVASEESDEVVVLASDRDPERVEALDGPTDCAIADDGSLAIVHRSAGVLRIDASGARRTVDGPPGAVAIARFDGRACVAREGAPSTVSCEGLGTLALDGVPLALVAASDALVVATRSPAMLVALAKTGDGLGVVARRALVVPAAALAADGPRVLAALGDYDEAGEARLGNHFVQDRVARFDARTLVLEDDRPTAWRTERQDHAGDVDRGASPLGLSPTPRGSVWVAFAGTDEIEEIGGALAAPRVIDTAGLGVSAPFSAVELADGTIAVTSPSASRVVVLSADGTIVRALALAPDDAALLRSDPDALRLRMGERAFYEATRSGVSCQSCHLHGGTDGAVHNIGGRLAAPTLDVRGLVGTSPYLRDGSYPRLRDLHEVADTEYRGYREPAGDRGATIEAWLETLPPPRTYVPRDPPLEREGLDVFFAAGCPDCHAPPAFTSLGLHAIEAVFPDAPARTEGRSLDVPSLRAFAASAPYLYDGRARTLEDVLAENERSDRHGRTRGLDAHRRAALLAFLRSL